MSGLITEVEKSELKEWREEKGPSRAASIDGDGEKQHVAGLGVFLRGGTGKGWTQGGTGRSELQGTSARAD